MRSRSSWFEGPGTSRKIHGPFRQPRRDCTISCSMRILMLTQTYSPVVGGEERMVEDLSRELARRGHEVAVATLRQPMGEPPESADGVRIHLLDSAVHSLPGLSTRRGPPLRAAGARPEGGAGAASPAGGRAAGRRPRPQLARRLLPAAGAPLKRAARPLSARLQPGLRDQAVLLPGRDLQRARAAQVPALTRSTSTERRSGRWSPPARCSRSRGCAAASTCSCRSARR